MGWLPLMEIWAVAASAKNPANKTRISWAILPEIILQKCFICES